MFQRGEVENQEPVSGSPWEGWLALMNPPLVVAAAAEALAGGFVASPSVMEPRLYLITGAAALLFAAGSLFSHLFDRAGDETRHPERPVPSGGIDAKRAWRVGIGLLAAAIVAGCIILAPTGRLVVMGLALCVVLYASTTKTVWGPNFLNLGAAHALAFLAGLAVSEGGLRYASAVLPILLYAVGWALLRAILQPGAPPSTAFMSLVHLAAALGVLLYQQQTFFNDLRSSLIFLLALLAVAFPRVVPAAMDPRRPSVAAAVQYGFLGLPLLAATVAGGAGYGGAWRGLAVALFCLPLYQALRRWPISIVTRPR